MESAANPTRHKILEILVESPGLGAKALADKMGVTRQHTAYHIGELLRLGLVKDVRAGSVVIYHVTDLGRTVLKRIHSISAPRTEEVARDAAARSAPSPATPAARSAFHQESRRLFAGARGPRPALLLDRQGLRR
ncbi:MAG: helix-turn-helix domain-containing protein [Candidatus Brockarchaeota archaeon]|nr:helix-turn-helix domain-containing protein [Candidatus Brockarchaeota archaeon]